MKPAEQDGYDLLRAERDLRGAIYWLLRVYEHDPHNYRTGGVYEWLTAHGYEPGNPKAKRLLARKRVPR